MIHADTSVLFRWTDDSFAITGWGVFLLLLLAMALSDRGGRS